MTALPFYLVIWATTKIWRVKVVPTMLSYFNTWLLVRAPGNQTYEFPAIKHFSNQGWFPNVSSGWPNHDRTGQFDNEIGFFKECLLKTVSLMQNIQDLIHWSSWIVLIKSEILIMIGMVWPVGYDK